jgi:hypothetical protein
LFWLVDPDLLDRVGALEHGGRVQLFQQRIREDLGSQPGQKALFAAQHERYAAMRWASMTNGEKRYAASRGYTESLRESGVGGYRSRQQVKCLHSHYADWLATRDNVVGEWVHDCLEAHEDDMTKAIQTLTNRGT